MSGLPPWARAYLDQHLPGNPVLSGRALSRNRVLANTRQGAVLVTRGLLGGIRHALVEVPQDRVAFRCAGCGHNLQFYALDLPATVYCSICAAKYHVGGAGAVTDAAGGTIASEGPAARTEGGDAGCACCRDGCCGAGDCCDHAGCGACCAQTGCCAAGCDPATCCADETCQCCVGEGKAPAPKASVPPAHAAHAPPAGAAATSEVSAFQHNGYTLYKRDVETKSGSRPLYFFSKGQPKSGEAAALPEGHEVGVNARTGLPFLRRGGAGTGSAGAAGHAPALHGYRGDSHPVIDVEGIGPVWAERLHQHGVKTTDELCRCDPQALAGAMGEAVETIRFWVEMADLMKVKGIGPQYAEALVRSGVHGIDAFRHAKVPQVVEHTNAWLDAQKQTVIKTRLTATRVQTWQKAARAMRQVRLEPHPVA